MSQYVHLDPDDAQSVERYLKARGLLDSSRSLVSVSKAGEGNMNLTLRVATEDETFILKQARPWVEKYPQIPAPDARALVEIAFYQAASSRSALRDSMPKLLASDPEARLLVLEDVGRASDFTSLYTGETLERRDLDSLVTYLVALHVRWKELPKVFANREMRALNHEHIFRLPLAADNGIDLDALTPGLQDAAASLKRDPGYVSRVTELGDLYLADGETLVHGDYFPGSWLRTDAGIRVIDPEFCFMGPPAFDLGVMTAHLYLANQPDEIIDSVLSAYRADDAVADLARRFAGVEIMRRLIGVAQLPLTRGLDEKRALLDRSRELVLSA